MGSTTEELWFDCRPGPEVYLSCTCTEGCDIRAISNSVLLNVLPSNVILLWTIIRHKKYISQHKCSVSGVRSAHTRQYERTKIKFVFLKRDVSNVENVEKKYAE